MVILEGMLNRLAIVASKVGGPAEILRHRKTGVLVPAKDSAALSDALIYLIRKPDLRKQLGNAAAKDAQTRWSWNNVIKKIHSLYLECVPKTKIISGL
jgi:glycosyltransferase involved in cell wall biosynthesis